MPVCLQLMKVEIVKEINMIHFNRTDYLLYIELLAKTDTFYGVDGEYLSQIPRWPSKTSLSWRKVVSAKRITLLAESTC